MRRWERKDEHGSYVTTEFDGAADVVDYLKALPSHWHNNENGGIAHSIRMLGTGDVRMVTEAEKLLERYETAGLLAPLTPVVRPSVVGFMPIVPAVIAGQPETMLAHDVSDAMSDRSPVTILVDCGVICNVSTDTSTKRGLAITALVLALQNVRPVKLAIFDTMSSHHWPKNHIMYQLAIPMNPPFLAQIAWMLSAREMAQDVPFTHTNEVRKQVQHGFTFAWQLLPHTAEYEKRVRAHWDLKPTDIVLVGGSNEQGIDRDPGKWVAAQIEKLKAAQ